VERKFSYLNLWGKEGIHLHHRRKEPRIGTGNGEEHWERKEDAALPAEKKEGKKVG